MSGTFHRRGFVQLAGAGIAGATLARAARAEATEPVATSASAQPLPPPPSADMNTSDILVETLIAWGAPFAFGVVGDGVNPVIEALRKRQDRIRFIPVRHEEAAAFMASGIAKHTGRLGVCVGTTGPGAVHLLNGLYDAHMDGAPVVAITGTTFHDLIGTRFQQGIDTTRLMQDVALYNVAVTSPGHALIVGNRACRAALGNRGVAHLTIAKDVQQMKLAADKPSMENHGLRTSSAWAPSAAAPSATQLRAAADLLNAGKRVAILAGQGALPARHELEQVAEMLAAPVAKSLLAKAVLPDDSPLTTGGIGHLGTEPSEWSMHNCDTVLILGSTMPWVDSYPRAGQARGVQVDLNPDRIGLRYPVEIGLAGDVRATLAGLLPLLARKSDRGFLQEAQAHMRDWYALLDRVESTRRDPLRPQMVVRAVSDLLADDAVISLDCGANTHFAARHLRLRTGQRLTGTGMLASMAPGLPFAIAAALASPGRQSVAIVGDGGFAQLMAELTTAVQQKLPVKLIVLKNDSLAEVKFEQRELGNPEFGCELAPIDFVAYAQACGADGFRARTPDDLRPAIKAALQSPRAALVEAVVDANEPPAKPGALRA
ncbi:MAG TPA: thiamine pyrophosphate-dependent enzyme [Xanthobacteraceae bacterium]|nr:thiamine pyrophosphate-dependent enzyme [Xanthobacteraceae bacterium]